MARLDDIVGYTYRAANHCPKHIIGAMPTGPGGEFDGWALAPGVKMSTEGNLDEIAAAFGIDRYDERSFDSGYFPKVVFRDQTDESDRCDTCGELLSDVWVPA